MRVVTGADMLALFGSLAQLKALGIIPVVQAELIDALALLMPEKRPEIEQLVREHVRMERLMPDGPLTKLLQAREKSDER